MADFPLPKDMVLSEALGIDSAASSLDTITSGNFTFGSWVELTSSTLSDTDGMVVIISQQDTSQNEVAIKIGVGGAGNEEIIVDRPHGQLNRINATLAFWFPIGVPSGVRLSAQTGTDASGTDIGVGVYLYSNAFTSPIGKSSTIAYGMADDSEGTNVDPGGTVNTKGSYVELDSSTSDDISEFLICISTNDNSSQADATWLLDIAIGGAGSEEIIVTDIYVGGSGVEITKPQIPIPEGIPAGTRISARTQCSITDATDRIIAISINGVID